MSQGGDRPKLLTKDEVRRIAVNIAKLAELLRARRRFGQLGNDLARSLLWLPLCGAFSVVFGNAPQLQGH